MDSIALRPDDLAPNGVTSRTHLFDRARLLIDLDEATDALSAPSVFVVIGFPRSADIDANVAVKPRVMQVGERVAELLGTLGSMYRTRSTEVCALLDVNRGRFGRFLREVEEGLEMDNEQPVSVGHVWLPDEATEAIEALLLGDARMGAVRVRQGSAASRKRRHLSSV